MAQALISASVGWAVSHGEAGIPLLQACYFINISVMHIWGYDLAILESK